MTIASSAFTNQESIPPIYTCDGDGINPPLEISRTGFCGILTHVPPCPPSGVHHYRFQLYALDKKLDLETGTDREELEEAMKNSILARAELVGIYSPEYPKE